MVDPIHIRIDEFEALPEQLFHYNINFDSDQREYRGTNHRHSILFLHGGVGGFGIRSREYRAK